MTAKRYDKAKSKLLKDAADELARNFETNRNFFPHYFERNREQRESFKELLIITNSLLISQWSESHTTQLINLFDFYFFTLENYPRIFNESLNVLSSKYPSILPERSKAEFPDTERKRLERMNKKTGENVIPVSENQFISVILKGCSKKLNDKAELQLNRLLLFYHYVKGAREKDFAVIELKIQQVKRFENNFLFLREMIDNRRAERGEGKITDAEIFQLMERKSLGKKETVIKNMKRIRETKSKKKVSNQTKIDGEKGLRIYDEIMELLKENIRPVLIIKRLKRQKKYKPELIEYAVIKIVYDSLINEKQLIHDEALETMRRDLSNDLIKKYLL
ncbi:MAG TPA: hypothetical protein ENN33_14025 [Ignavibacteria bacterium]|nr:hypothetical protein [Ignavibacteria bacterium]